MRSTCELWQYLRDVAAGTPCIMVVLQKGLLTESEVPSMGRDYR